MSENKRKFDPKTSDDEDEQPSKRYLKEIDILPNDGDNVKSGCQEIQFTELPDEIKLKIFRYLPWRTILKVLPLVSKSFQELSKDPYLLTELSFKTFLETAQKCQSLRMQEYKTLSESRGLKRLEILKRQDRLALVKSGLSNCANIRRLKITSLERIESAFVEEINKGHKISHFELLVDNIINFDTVSYKNLISISHFPSLQLKNLKWLKLRNSVLWNVATLEYIGDSCQNFESLDIPMRDLMCMPLAKWTEFLEKRKNSFKKLNLSETNVLGNTNWPVSTLVEYLQNLSVCKNFEMVCFETVSWSSLMRFVEKIAIHWNLRQMITRDFVKFDPDMLIFGPGPLRRCNFEFYFSKVGEPNINLDVDVMSHMHEKYGKDPEICGLLVRKLVEHYPQKDVYLKCWSSEPFHRVSVQAKNVKSIVIKNTSESDNDVTAEGHWSKWFNDKKFENLMELQILECETYDFSIWNSIHENCPNLQSLGLEGRQELGRSLGLDSIKNLNIFHKLKKLTLKNVKKECTSNDWVYFFRTSIWSNLVELDLGNSGGIDDEVLRSICEKYPSLISLKLSEPNLSDSRIRSVNLIWALKRLKVLHVKFAKYVNNSNWILLFGNKNMKQLEELDLTGSSGVDEEVSGMIFSNCPNLKKSNVEVYFSCDSTSDQPLSHEELYDDSFLCELSDYEEEEDEEEENDEITEEEGNV